MENKSLAAREFTQGQPCLDFNETRLPKYHKVFANPQGKFDTSIGRYVPVPKDGTMSQVVADNQQQLQLLPEQSTSPSSNLPRRPFWDEMLPLAMVQLGAIREEPAGIVSTSNSIRAAAGWPEIVNTLEVARAKYYNYSDFIGFWKKTGRKVADHATDGKTLLSLLPHSEYTSVIHCVFDVIFDVMIPLSSASVCLIQPECLTRCRQPKGQPRFERKSRIPCAECGRTCQMWNASLRSAPTMTTI